MENIWYGVFGQEHAKKTLEKIIFSGKTPHAFLFSGPDGVGKFFTSIRFAQILNLGIMDNYDQSATGHKLSYLLEPYIKYIIPLPRGKNETGDSTSFEKLSKDLIEEYNEALANKIKNPYYKVSISNSTNIKISSIREINKFISLNYSDIKYRIILISDAHLMNEEAQNALLKNLEEPPEGVIFILLTSNKNQLLETINSRCWTVNFEPLHEDSLTLILNQYFVIDENTARVLSVFASGSVYKALDFIDQDAESLLGKTVNILRYSLASKLHSAYKEFQTILSDNSGVLMKLLLQMIIFWLNDVQRNRISAKEVYFSQHQDTIEKFNLRFPNSDILGTLTKLSAIEQALERNVNLNIAALNIILELTSLRY